MENKVDKDVQSLLKPLNLMQYFMFCPKYRIKGDFITPKSLISNTISMIVTLLFIVTFIFCTYLVNSNKESLGYTTFMTGSSNFECIFFCFGFAMNFLIEIIQTDNNVRFVLTFQKVHRLLNTDCASHFIIWNWILGVIPLGFHITIMTYSCIQLNIPFYAVSHGYLLMRFDLNMVYTMRLMKLLESKLNLWNFQSLNSRKLESQEISFNTKSFQAFHDILECYNLYKASFQHLILYHIMSEFIFAIIYTEVAIETSMINHLNMDEVIFGPLTIVCWSLKDLFWITILIHQLEGFYLAVQNVQDTCAIILDSTCSDDEKKNCKNILRLHRASFNKLQLCGLFSVDATLQLSLMSLISDYIVVLLQFAFL